MGEVVRLVPKAELERTRLVLEARAIYESVFPSLAASEERWHGASTGRTIGNANFQRHNDVRS